MVKTSTSIRLLGLALLLVFSVNSFAQDSIPVNATPLHRFLVNYSTLGHYLTPDFNGGANQGYAFQPWPAQADIVPLVSGYAPRGDQGLFPIHAWRVHEGSRIYYYYNIYFGSHGSNYAYLGIIGYGLAKFDPRGTRFHYWYSQSKGYYFTLDNEYPPCCSFTYHDFSWTLPVGGTFIFDRIPDPVDPCGEDAPQQRQDCAFSGGIWDDSSCSCQFGCFPYCNQY